MLAELWHRTRQLLHPPVAPPESWLDRCSIPEDDGLDPEATTRADLMLREELGPEYARLTAQGYLDVTSTLFRNTSYRLRMRRPIEVFKNGRPQRWRLCVTPVERVPAADELLMKLVWLRANEEYVLTTANRVR